MCPKIHTEKKEYESPEEVQALKILISTGDSYFKIQSLKVGINRQPRIRMQDRYMEETAKSRGFSGRETDTSIMNI